MRSGVVGADFAGKGTKNSELFCEKGSEGWETGRDDTDVGFCCSPNDVARLVPCLQFSSVLTALEWYGNHKVKVDMWGPY